MFWAARRLGGWVGELVCPPSWWRNLNISWSPSGPLPGCFPALLPNLCLTTPSSLNPLGHSHAVPERGRLCSAASQGHFLCPHPERQPPIMGGVCREMQFETSIRCQKNSLWAEGVAWTWHVQNVGLWALVLLASPSKEI